MFSAASSGFALGASLIIAIGAQNAFILRQGLIRSHVFVLGLICALADGLLIAAGVGGLGTLVARSPTLITVVTLGGAVFLAAY
ncbi:MAG TPA: LysE family transporter, partial [Pseudorhizobium sp.]|nr:LysE family transporter [Pseudorhizobium sp.]